VTLKGETIAAEFQRIVDDYVVRHYTPHPNLRPPGGRASIRDC
jgi:hypothetical protein